VPNLYIISGCNGAGKTTASFTILPDMLDCKEFVNADEIAKGLSPFQPETIRRRYSRGTNNLINKFIELCDFWIIINNSSKAFSFVAEGQSNTQIKIHDEPIWQLFKKQRDEKD